MLAIAHWPASSLTDISLLSEAAPVDFNELAVIAMRLKLQENSEYLKARTDCDGVIGDLVCHEWVSVDYNHEAD